MTKITDLWLTPTVRSTKYIPIIFYISSFYASSWEDFRLLLDSSTTTIPARFTTPSALAEEEKIEILGSEDL